MLRMVCCTGSVTSPLHFWSNFIKGWGSFANILYSSKMGETAFTNSGWFSPNLSKLPDLDKTTSRQVFKIAFVEPVTVIEVGPFLELWANSYTELDIISSMVGYTSMTTSLAIAR